jgi:hypothetical protein
MSGIETAVMGVRGTNMMIKNISKIFVAGSFLILAGCGLATEHTASEMANTKAEESLTEQPVDPEKAVGRTYYLLSDCMGYQTNASPPHKIYARYRDSFRFIKHNNKISVDREGGPGNDAFEMFPYDPEVFHLINDAEKVMYKEKVYVFLKSKPLCSQSDVGQ